MSDSSSGGRSRAVWLVAIFLVVGAPAAHADNTADEADLAFALGNQAWVTRRYEEALRNYFLSYRLVPNRNVLFNIARCYEALERFDEAYRYYYDLSRTDLGEDDRREVTKALDRLRPRVALVHVTTEPPGADIYVDRVDLGSRGTSPLTLALPPGTHAIVARRAGYRNAETSVQMAKGREAQAALPLTLITGTVRLTGTPAGAWIRETVDGPVLGTLPGAVKLPPGRRVLHVGAEHFATQQYLVDVKADDTVTLEVKLGAEPLPTGKLIVTANRANATVTVDGVEAGFTPAVLSLTEGDHDVVVSLPELTPQKERIHITRDRETRLVADLRYRPPPVKAASKSLASVDEAPASITVITREEIEAFGCQTLADALAAVRGMYLSNDRLYTYVGVRGFSPPGDLNTRVLILWDGHALNDVWAGQGYSARDLDVDLDEVARIEVVRGPGSALYGTGAFFAVINVVPRDSLGSRRNVELTGGAGSLGAFRGHLAAGLHSDDDHSVLFSLSGYGAKGADVTPLPPLGDVIGLDGERALGGSMRARVGDFTLFAQINRRDKDIPTAPFGTLVNAPGTHTADARGFAEARWDKTFANGNTASARAYYDASRYRGTWPTPAGEDGTGLLDFRDAGGADWVGTEGRFRFTLFGENRLTLGAEAQLQLRVYQQMFAETDAPEERYSRTLLSAYLLDEWRLHPRVFLSVGLRVDKYLDLAETPITPRLALILRPYEHGVTKLVVGQAFRAPNVYELYYNDLNLTQRPALTLLPERITTFEIEHSHDLTDELRVTLAGYHNRIENLVVLDTDTVDPPECGAPLGTEPCLVYRNVPGLALRAFGAEAGLRWQPGRHALVDASYSFVNLVGASSEVQSGTPAHLASGRVMLPLIDPTVRGSLQVTYQSARYSERVPKGAGEALIVNVGLSGGTERLRYFAGVQNLLDARYAIPVGDEFATPTVAQYGRTFAIQLTGSY
ncbi:MAG: TonB-dependent receptor [Myxococcaceae bacterium]|nr:TonB-dependent receptor [Myxococcaceae bacterium]